MKKNNYSARRCTESISPKKVHEPIVGRFTNHEGKWVFVPKGFLHVVALKELNKQINEK
jgi:hypothetical protein